MKLRLFIIILLLFNISAWSQETDSSFVEKVDNESLFNKANEAYVADDYHNSINLYMAIVNNGVESSELYFNLGNAFFKQGDIPHAILYFEKAKKIAPDDEDIRNNLGIANLKTVDKVESKPELPFTAMWMQLLNVNLIDEWGRQSIILSFIALLIMLVFLFSKNVIKKISFFVGLFIFLLSFSFYVMGELQKSQHVDSRYGIIFSSSITVKSSPENDGTKLFVIHEGTKVEILRKEGEWTQISLMNGNNGWLKSESFKDI